MLRVVRPRWPIPANVGRRRIAWSAHHSIATGWSDFGMFPSLAEPMLAWASEAQDTEFVFPAHPAHPALAPFTANPESPVGQSDYDTWLDRRTALPNAAVGEPCSYPATLAAADLLITDGLSMLVDVRLRTDFRFSWRPPESAARPPPRP